MRSRITTTLAVLLTLGILLTGCSKEVEAEMTTQDTGGIGMTLAEVQNLTLEEEYNLFLDRYATAGKLLTEAQNQVHSDPWGWSSSGVLPQSGIESWPARQLPGGNSTNSYMLEISRVYQSEGTGDSEDLKPMRDYFTQQGWQIVDRGVGGKWPEVLGYTPDGYILRYELSHIGRYALTVYSQLFWTNNERALSEAVMNRVHLPPPVKGDSRRRSSLPGVYDELDPWNAQPPVTSPKTQRP